MNETKTMDRSDIKPTIRDLDPAELDLVTGGGVVSSTISAARELVAVTEFVVGCVISGGTVSGNTCTVPKT